MDQRPQRRCGLCTQPGHDRRRCRAATLYAQAHPEIPADRIELYRNEIIAFAAEGLPPPPPPPVRVQCMTGANHPIYEDRFRCRVLSIPGGHYCAACDARRPRPDLPVAERCTVGQCMCKATEERMCKIHYRRELARRQRVWLTTVQNDADDFMTRTPQNWRDVIASWDTLVVPNTLGMTELRARRWWFQQRRMIRSAFARGYFIRELWNDDNPDDPMDENGVINWHWQRNHRPTNAPARGSLGALAADTQNVHTAPVSAQTAFGMKKLLDVKPSNEHDARKLVIRVMAHTAHKNITTVNEARTILRDFDHWYSVSMCRQPGDWLYKKLMDGLTSTIATTKDRPLRHELYKRLFEEMKESVGMCCDGHITRIVNVLVGFDEAFAPELTVAEKVQNLFASLAAKNCSLLEKVAEGVQNLRKFGVPENEWEPWIDAL